MKMNHIFVVGVLKNVRDFILDTLRATLSYQERWVFLCEVQIVQIIWIWNIIVDVVNVWGTLSRFVWQTLYVRLS